MRSLVQSDERLHPAKSGERHTARGVFVDRRQLSDHDAAYCCNDDAEENSCKRGLSVLQSVAALEDNGCPSDAESEKENDEPVPPWNRWGMFTAVSGGYGRE